MRLLGNHPNLVRTGDMFAWNDDSSVEPVEYLEFGHRLEVLLDIERAEDIPWLEKERIIKGAANGLMHAHRSGFVHRDIRPVNILVDPEQVKLANIDLAYFPNAPNLSIAQSVQAHFDQLYIAPEIWQDPRHVDPPSDIYSLGLVFYLLITGQPPVHDFEGVLGGKGIAIDTELLREGLKRIEGQGYMHDSDGAFEVVSRMCSPESAERYGNLESVLEDLAIVDA